MSRVRYVYASFLRKVREMSVVYIKCTDKHMALCWQKECQYEDSSISDVRNVRAGSENKPNETACLCFISLVLGCRLQCRDEFLKSARCDTLT